MFSVPAVLVLVLFMIVLTGVAGAAALTAVAVRGAVRAGRTASRRLERARTSAWAAIPGPTQQVHAERARVHREIDSALAAFTTGYRAGRPVQVLAPHADALARAARHLDVDLAVIAAEPDPLARAAWLTDVRPRVDVLATACGELRHGVLLAGDTWAAADLQLAARSLADHVEYLAARSAAHRDLSARYPA